MALPPNASERPLDPQGYFSKAWLAYFRSLGISGSDAAINEALAELRDRIAAIEARGAGLITGPASVRVFGTLVDGVVQLTLRGDDPDPGATYYYGTNADGTKGFWPLPDPPTPMFPIVTGEVPPVFVYGPDGSLAYGPVH